MKKIIDKESGRIISILNVDEAKKILEMYINYCLGKRDATQGRLNLVNYLGDFVKYGDKRDVTKFYDVLVKGKDSFEFSKNDMKAYESLMTFFEMYNNIEKGDFDVAALSSYINSANSKKQEIEAKLLNNEDLSFEEKLNNIFFNKDFDITILAKNACEKWEEQLKRRIEENNGELDVSLKEEIAYQDLIDLCSSNTSKANTIKNDNKKDVENITTNVEDKQEEPINSNDMDKEPKNEPEVEEKDQSEVGPIINNIAEKEKEETKEEPKKEEKPNDKPSSDDDLIIGSSSIREATQDVSLRDAANMFNDAIDNRLKNNNSSQSDTSYGTLRDQ